MIKKFKDMTPGDFFSYNENEYVGINKYIRVKESYYDIDNSSNYVIIKINTYNRSF